MKKIINSLLIIFAVVLAYLFVLGLITEPQITKAVKKTYVGNILISDLVSDIKRVNPNISSTTLRKVQTYITDSKELDNIASKYVDGVITSILNRNANTVNIDQNLQNIIGKIDTEFGVKINLSDINMSRLNALYESGIEYVEEKGNSKYNVLLFIYRLVTNDIVRFVMFILITASLVGIALINKNLIKTLLYYSAFCVSLFILSILSIVPVEDHILEISEAIVGRPTILDFTSSYISSVGFLAISILLLLAARVLKYENHNKKVVKKRKA